MLISTRDFLLTRFAAKHTWANLYSIVPPLNLQQSAHGYVDCAFELLNVNGQAHVDGTAQVDLAQMQTLCGRIYKKVSLCGGEVAAKSYELFTAAANSGLKYELQAREWQISQTDGTERVATHPPNQVCWDGQELGDGVPMKPGYYLQLAHLYVVSATRRGASHSMGSVEPADTFVPTVADRIILLFGQKYCQKTANQAAMNRTY